MNDKEMWDELEKLKEEKADWYIDKVRKYIIRAKEPPGELNWKEIVSLLAKNFGIKVCRDTIRKKWYNDKERKNDKSVHDSSGAGRETTSDGD